MEDIEKHHAADAETNTWIQSNASLEVKGKACVIPQPSTLGKLHDIAGDKLQDSRDDHDADKDKYRCDQDFPKVQPFLLKSAQGKDQDKSAHSVYDTVRTEEYAPVGKSPSVYNDFEKHFVDPSEDGVHHKIKIIFS